MTVTLPEGWEAWAERVAAHARAAGTPLRTEADVLAAVRDYTETSERLTNLVLHARADRNTGPSHWREPHYDPAPEAGDLIVGWLADTTYDEFRAEAGLT